MVSCLVNITSLCLMQKQRVPLPKSIELYRRYQEVFLFQTTLTYLFSLFNLRLALVMCDVCNLDISLGLHPIAGIQLLAF